MKKMILAACMGLFFGQLNAQCPAGATAGDVQAPAITTYTPDNVPGDLATDLSADAVGWEGTTNYAQVMTFPPNDLDLEVIAAVSYDGEFDMSTYDDGEYCFLGFGYNQAELDDVTGNLILRNLLNQGLPQPCVLAGMALDEIFICVKDNPLFNTDSTALTLENVVSVLEGQAADVLGYVPCLTVEENTHCITKGLTNGLEDFDELNGIKELKAFPNPTSGQVSIEIVSSKVTEAVVTILDQRGSIVMEEILALNAGANEKQIDLSGLSNGLYLYQVSVDGESRSSRIQLVK